MKPCLVYFSRSSCSELALAICWRTSPRASAYFKKNSDILWTGLPRVGALSIFYTLRTRRRHEGEHGLRRRSIQLFVCESEIENRHVLPSDSDSSNCGVR